MDPEEPLPALTPEELAQFAAETDDYEYSSLPLDCRPLRSTWEAWKKTLNYRTCRPRFLFTVLSYLIRNRWDIAATANDFQVTPRTVRHYIALLRAKGIEQHHIKRQRMRLTHYERSIGLKECQEMHPETRFVTRP